jgi:hypothetical protein
VDALNLAGDLDNNLRIDTVRGCTLEGFTAEFKKDTLVFRRFNHRGHLQNGLIAGWVLS